MKPRYRLMSLLLVVLWLAGCAGQVQAPATPSLSTAALASSFTLTPPLPPTKDISPENTPSRPALDEHIAQLPSLSLPAFNARYSTREMALTSDRQIMAVIAKDRLQGEESIWLWDVNDFDRSLAAFQSVISSLDAIALSPDGRKLAVGGKGMIVVLDWKSGKWLEQIPFAHPGSGTVEVLFGPNNTLLSSHYNGQLTIWDLATKQARYSVEITANPALLGSFTISPDGTTLVAGLNDEIHLWEFETGRLRDVVRNPGDTHFTSFTYSFDGNWIATGGCNQFGFESCTHGQVMIWNSELESPSITISNYPSGVGLLEFSPKNNSLAIANSGDVELFDLATGKSIHAPQLGHVPGKLAPAELFHRFDMRFLSDGSVVAVSTTEGIQLLDLNRMSWLPNLRFILSLGYPYVITPVGDNLNLRMEPSMKGGIIKRLYAGEQISTIDGPEIVGEQVWWEVQLADGTAGWIVEMPGWYEFIP